MGTGKKQSVDQFGRFLRRAVENVLKERPEVREARSVRSSHPEDAQVVLPHFLRGRRMEEYLKPKLIRNLTGTVQGVIKDH